MVDMKSNVLREDCIEDRRLELTNRKTYGWVEMERRIQNSVREGQLERLMKRTKRRSGTSNANNNRQEESSVTVLPLKTTLKQMAQTL